jgi:hypothetical protein
MLLVAKNPIANNSRPCIAKYPSLITPHGFPCFSDLEKFNWLQLFLG